MFNSEFLLKLSDVGNDSPEYLETLFTLSNGHVGVRASEPIKRGFVVGNPGTFMNGFYDSYPIVYGEWAYGYAKNHQTIVKLPDIRGIVLEIEGERSDQSQWSITKEAFYLDMHRGKLEESYLIRTKNNKQLKLTIQSFTSFKYREIYASKYSISESNFAGEVIIEKDLQLLNLKQTKLTDTSDPRVASSKSQLKMAYRNSQIASLTTEQSQQTVLFTQMNQQTGELQSVDPLISRASILVQPRSIKSAINVVAFSDFYVDTKVTEQTVEDFQKRLTGMTYEELLIQQEQMVNDFWTVSDIRIDGHEALQKGLRFNLFHLFQSAGREGKTNYSAKGLTGEGYEGHYFWDTEMYILPFFIYTQPEIAKELLSYRHYILPKAKERAKEMGQKGALFAWRTINGEEASAYYPAGTAQVHINADISYAFQLYEKVTGDSAFIKEVGAEVIYETARFWLSYGSWIKKNGKQQFCINGVTGPDEYTALVNNNYYTNKMAQNNLRYAVELAERYHNLSVQNEYADWRKAAEAIYLPYDEETKRVKQDDSFFEKEVWPFSQTPKENYPLLLHYHPMVIYKYQVCKQADALLAELLFPQDYSKEQIIRDYEYYESVTTHDSSLSRSVFSILASRTDQPEKGYSYFMDTALMDLTDLQGNVKDGIHAANMGGSWLSMIYGFAGLSYLEDKIVVRNHLPEEIKELEFKLKIAGNLIAFHISLKRISAEIKEAGKPITITADKSVITIKLTEG
ncbi:glycoside hydrolase family 65 protein [Enterococcus rivorum]|uniref:Maltose phosphorylase n=1 Tax=Enterococcus rivorum TaxID=762845 RepID=A0A1E5KUA5_9ENTE|nr:glycoside hydrolase family 65 protein [Enterococcus rivorum]MBP2098961.1 alpha,alpha-trehalose phosphorylase [Enterococcus rivorum]OEH81443.1 maltose phosphorylase [Enterococcus rivorum]